MLLVLLVFLAIAVLAPWYGTDSRDLRDHPWERTPGATRPDAARLPQPRAARDADRLAGRR